ncbi:Chemotaxis protein methyltransferase CheR [Minicystis rosea]|nr:Chemotaxis protein methyltransferase CheR [Minicystis rosea]
MSAPAPVPAWLRDALAAEVRRAFGITFPPSRRINLDSGLRQAAEMVTADDLGELLHRLERDDPEARRAVVGQLMIGETYFFRYVRHFTLLREILERFRREPIERPRLLWSAGCSTGEEAYSMAIAALEVLGAEAGAAVRILGTDLNPAALTRAREGLYDEWSFREVPNDVRARWFARQGGRFRVHEAARSLVRFAPLNLIPDGDVVEGHAEGWPRAVDLVFCRNVMLYFDAASAAQTGAALARSLVPGGLLVLGPADPRLAIDELASVVDDGIIYYQRRSVSLAPSAPSVAPSPPSTPPASRITPIPASRATPVPASRIMTAPSQASTLPPEPRSSPSSSRASEPASELAHARRLADRGEAVAALDLLDRLIAERSLDAEAYVLRALVLSTLSNHARAALDAERAILLDPTSPMAHMLAAVSSGRLGHHEDARRSLRNALKLLARADAVDAGAGASKEELAAAATQIARALEAMRTGSGR